MGINALCRVGLTYCQIVLAGLFTCVSYKVGEVILS